MWFFQKCYILFFLYYFICLSFFANDLKQIIKQSDDFL